MSWPACARPCPSPTWKRTCPRCSSSFMTPPRSWRSTPYADAAYEDDTNFFALANNVPEPVGSGGPTRSDSFEKYKAGFEAAYDWSLQELFADAEGRRFEYSHFTTLDHDEYLLHGRLKWKLARVLD